MYAGRPGFDQVLGGTYSLLRSPFSVPIPSTPNRREHSRGGKTTEALGLKEGTLSHNIDYPVFKHMQCCLIVFLVIVLCNLVILVAI